MSEFDLQTDFSFLGISCEEVVKPKQANGQGVTTVGNKSVGIGLTHNRKQSAETRAKISANHRGGPRVGYKKSAETIAKLKSVRKTEEQKAKIRAARAKQTFSAETKAKMAESHRQRHAFRAEQAPKIQTPNGVFKSVKHIAEVAGVSTETVRRWMKKYPQHYYIKEAK